MKTRHSQKNTLINIKKKEIGFLWLLGLPDAGHLPGWTSDYYLLLEVLPQEHQSSLSWRSPSGAWSGLWLATFQMLPLSKLPWEPRVWLLLQLRPFCNHLCSEGLHLVGRPPQLHCSIFLSPLMSAFFQPSHTTHSQRLINLQVWKCHRTDHVLNITSHTFVRSIKEWMAGLADPTFIW